ncbi:MAG: hypothetical protein FWF59_02200 [Turicibacter sp.]|nr:hypothetical protein [Turicibacter sp.]
MGTAQSFSMATASVAAFILIQYFGNFWLGIGVLLLAVFSASVFSIRISSFLYQAVQLKFWERLGAVSVW